MNILGIETSCDETAAAVVVDGTKLLTNVVASSQEMHAKFGGIIPEKAAREQLKSIIPVITEAMGNHQIDALAVTYGPGLIGSLLVGVETAKALAFAWNKPLIPVNHLIGHIYANWLDGKTPQFPALVLLVSGGHTELILMANHGKFKYLGGTRDDAAGECFDKCGRLLNLPYPYGPYIEKLSEEFDPQNKLGISFPRPMLNDKNLEFSFSGLKTAFLNEYTKINDKTRENELAYALQEAVTDVLTEKTARAILKYRPVSLLVAGGVSANKKLREKLNAMVQSRFPNLRLFIPPISLCTDNASYIASAAFFNYHEVPWEKVNADPSLQIR